MSSTLLPATAQHNETHETTNNILTTNGNEEKQSIDFLLSESKRLVKSGLYKKAFNLVEAFKPELGNISVVNNIKLCRRMVYCLTKICDRYLSKGDIQRTDHFTNLMNKSHEYLQTWNDLLCAFIRKSNPKYENLQEALDEASAIYEEGLELGNVSRIRSRKDVANHSSTFISMGDTRDTRDTTKHSFTLKPRGNVQSAKYVKRQSYLEDMSAMELGSRLATENFDGSEINANYHLDQFVKYYLLTLFNWSNFFKKVVKRYDAAYKFLSLADKLTRIMDLCLDPEALNVVVQIRLALGVFYCEFGKYQEALAVFELTINTVQTEISLIYGRNQEDRENYMFKLRLRQPVRLLILLFMNLALTHEQIDNYSRVLETLKFGMWFALKFLSPEDDIYQLINTQNNIAQQRYEKYLRDLGELERLVGIRQDRLVEDNKETAAVDHFAKVNRDLYKKFSYDKLNASQYIVLNTSTVNYGRESISRNNKSETMMDDKLDFIESKHSWSRVKDLQSDLSVGRTMVTQDDNDSPQTMGSWKRQPIVSKTALKDKRKLKAKKLNMTADSEMRNLTSDYYRAEVDLEKEREEFEINSEEEREYIEELNRNIKDGKKQSKNVITKKKNDNDVFDLDRYFSSFVDKKIKQKEEEERINPTTFKRMVKNYAHFVKREVYDKNEFGFAKRCLLARHKEILADYPADTKYKAPAYKVAQMNGVKIEAQHHEAKFEADRKVKARDVNAKDVSKSQSAKTVKFADQETRTTGLVPIEEDSIQNSSKQNLLAILSKHKKKFGLTSFDASFKANEKNQRLANTSMNSSVHQSRHSMSSTAFWRGRSKDLSKEGQEHAYDPARARTHSESTNNMIHLLMESVEKNIEETSNFQKRIMDSRPQVSMDKPNTRFLKVSDELAKSTQDISHKFEGGKKVWNFSQAVKFAQVANKKMVTIKTPTNNS